MAIETRQRERGELFFFHEKKRRNNSLLERRKTIAADQSLCDAWRIFLNKKDQKQDRLKLTGCNQRCIYYLMVGILFSPIHILLLSSFHRKRERKKRRPALTELSLCEKRKKTLTWMLLLHPAQSERSRRYVGDGKKPDVSTLSRKKRLRRVMLKWISTAPAAFSFLFLFIYDICCEVFNEVRKERDCWTRNGRTKSVFVMQTQRAPILRECCCCCWTVTK